MANVNAPAGQAPIMAPLMRTDDQISPHIRWVPIGKSNCYLDVEKPQSNPIYKIACQLDEQWFDLTKDTLKYTLQITHVINNQAFTSPPSSNALINFVNELGYPKLVRNLSNVGVVNRAHIDYAERIWEEFTQSIHTFIEDKRNLAHHTHGKKKANLIVIPSIRFTKLIIYHLQRKHKFHPRPDSSLHLPNEEHVLGYLKFSAKGTKREVFGMPIPGSLIITDIQEALYYQPCLVSKRRKPISSLRSVNKSVAEDVLEKEPRVDDEEADVQRALEESLKSMYDVPRGLLPPVVTREPESGKYQPLPEVPEKGKEKVIEEQVARDLLTLQTPKKKSLADRYIFQRRTATPTGSFGHDESSSLYAELGLTNSEEESEEDVPGADAGGQGEGQAGPDPGAQDEGQAGSNPDEQAEGQAGPDPGFTATAYQKVQENKLTVEEHVILEEPASSSGTLSSLQHLTKDLNFGDLFFSDKPSEADNDKATAETEAESMVSITIQQDTSSIPPMTTSIIDLTSRPESPKVHQLLKATATETTITTTTTTTILPPPSQQQQSTTDAMMMKRIGELEHIMENLIQENKRLEQRDLPKADIKEILHQRMWETDSYKTHEDHMQLYKALEKSMNSDHSEELAKDLAEARKKKKKSRESPKTPPGSPPHQPHPPPPPAGPSGASGSPGAFGSSQVPPPPPPPPSINQQGQSKGSAAPSSSKTATSAEYQAWTATDIRLKPSISFTPVDLQMDDDMAPDEQAQSSDDEDIGNAHILKVNLRQDWWKPLDIERPGTPEPTWSILLSDVHVLRNNWASALASNYSPPPEDLLLAQLVISPCLWTGSVRDEESLNLNYKTWKALHLKSSKSFILIAVRTHMRILSVVRIEVFSMYGYDYMKKIVLRRADLNEHVITERDFKHLVIRQRVEDFQLGIESYQTQLNLTKSRWDATGFEYKHDYTVIDSLRNIDEALDYRVKEFKINRMNSGFNTRFWTRKDVDRSKEFMFAIQKRLKTRRIFRNLEGFEKYENKGRVSTEMELELEHTQRGSSYEVSKHLLLSDIEDSVIDPVTYKFNFPSHSRWQSAPASDHSNQNALLSLEPRYHPKIISVGHCSNMLASSYTVKSKTDIKSPTHYPCGIARTSE
nr:E-beta-farnesene synthase [Tanacetum cinerariifolium]